MQPNVRPTTRAVPIERTGSPMCVQGVHIHCSRCGRCDVPQGAVYSAPLRSGGHFPPLCRDCAVKIMRIRSVDRAVLALEAGCE